MQTPVLTFLEPGPRNCKPKVQFCHRICASRSIFVVQQPVGYEFQENLFPYDRLDEQIINDEEA